MQRITRRRDQTVEIKTTDTEGHVVEAEEREDFKNEERA